MARYEERRGSASSRLYGALWQAASKLHLAMHPLCQYCQARGLVTAARLVDHFYPHKGDRTLFWDARWWVSSCTPCHSGWKQILERKGKAALDAVAQLLGLPVRP